jgi:hypothetical protein
MPGRDPFELAETRSFTDCWHQASVSRQSVVVLEVSLANLPQLARELARYRSGLPHVPVFVVGPRFLAEAEVLIREWGAVHVVFSPRALGPMIRICRRQWKRQVVNKDVADPWDKLPWGPTGDPARAQGENMPSWLTQRGPTEKLPTDRQET